MSGKGEGDDGVQLLKRVCKELAKVRGEEEEESRALDVIELLEAVADGARHRDLLKTLYYSVWLRPLCVPRLSDKVVMDLIELGSATISLEKFNELWSIHRPRDCLSISGKDRITLRDVFNSIKTFEETELGQDRDAVICAGSIFAAFDRFVEIRAQVSTCEWLDDLISKERPIMGRFIGVFDDKEELEFEDFVGILHSSLSYSRHLKKTEVTLDEDLLRATVGGKRNNRDCVSPSRTRHGWPIPDFSVVTHFQIEQLAEQLDVNPETEPYLLPIVKQALETKLPSDWELVSSPESKEHEENANENVFFRNIVSNQESIEHPAKNYFLSLIDHERQQRDQMLEFEGQHALSNQDPKKAWMPFLYQVSRSRSARDGDGKRKPTIANVLYYYNFSRHAACNNPPSEIDGYIIKDENGTISSQALRTFPIKKNIENGVFGSKASPRSPGKERRTPTSSFESRLMSKQQQRPTIKINEITTLCFTSWWNDTAISVPGCQTKRYVDVYYHIDSGNFQIIIQGAERVFTFSHLVDRFGHQVEAWDLCIGAKINILGRPTTLMQASLQTLKWLQHHSKKFNSAWVVLQKELIKYDTGINSGTVATLKVRQAQTTERATVSGKVSLRAYLDDIKLLSNRLAMYRPKLAAKILGPSLIAQLGIPNPKNRSKK